MKANQATLIDGWDRKEEPLIAFAAAFSDRYTRGWTVRFFFPFFYVAREVYYPIAGATF